METYRVSFLQLLKLVMIPVDVCLERGENPGRLRGHFMYWYWKSNIEIIQEGPEPLPRCDHCGMHMLAARMIRHRRMSRRNNATEMHLGWRDVEMAKRCEEMDFILYGREGGKLVEKVVTFKYLGWPLDQTDDGWLLVRLDIKRERKVWGRLGKILRREGPVPRVLEMFCRVVIQVVILFGLDTWVLLAATERTVEGTHTGFLRHITGKRM